MAQQAPPPASATSPDEVVDAKPLIEYPTVYTFKVMGKQAPDFVESVRALFRQALGAEPSPDALQEQPSGKGTYISLTVSVRLESEAQRQAVYARLYEEKQKEKPRIVYYL